MGRDKAYLPVSGSTLGARTAEQVRLAAGNVTLIGDPERYAALGYPVLADRYPGEGPLGGIITALAATEADWNLVVACDMPGLSAEFLQSLLDAAESKQLKIMVTEGQSGRCEPLCAVYHREAGETLEHAFAEGVRKVTSAFGELTVGVYRVAGMAQLRNLNTPEEWAGYVAE